MSVSYSVANPKLDFLCPIRISALDSEIRFHVSGCSTRRSLGSSWKTLTVNFIAGNSVAFHMEVQVKPFMVSSIVLNYLTKRYWKQEGLMRINFEIGDTFDISVVNKEDYFNCLSCLPLGTERFTSGLNLVPRVIFYSAFELSGFKRPHENITTS
ncbi:hypothetical protein Ddc_18077 [Ditylenchus destructor]|nr:hypothetical protein Ddc_18077 [Ditylenchus destructor]